MNKNVVLEMQKARNKLLRVLEKKRMRSRIPVRTMQKNQRRLSVNKLSAQLKLTEVWKAKYTENYLIKR